MLTYWKITFTIALVAVLVGAIKWAIGKSTPVDKITPKKFRAFKILSVSTDLLTLAFIMFVVIGLGVEVWA
jgi:cell division protein FtsX